MSRRSALVVAVVLGFVLLVPLLAATTAAAQRPSHCVVGSLISWPKGLAPDFNDNRLVCKYFHYSSRCGCYVTSYTDDVLGKAK